MAYQKSKISAPETIHVPGGLKVGTQIIIRGKVPYGTEAFAINFQCHEHDGCNIPFHFNPRPSSGETIRNSFDGNWQEEETHQPDFPFAEGRKFLIRFFVTEEEYKVMVNGRDFIDYRHRLPPQEVQCILLGSNAEYYDISIQNSMQSPYIGEFPNGMKVGQALRLRAAVNQDASGFVVNFNCDCGGDTVAFHFNPRTDQNEVIRNSKIGDWGEEEKEQTEFPFAPGDFFDALFIATHDRFNIYVNAKLFATFNYRCSIEDVTHIHVDGEISINSVEFFDPLPDGTLKDIPSGLDKSDMILVRGFFYPEGNTFVINLLYGQSSDDDIALHFNPRRDQGELVLNSRAGGEWQQEETHPLPTAQELLPFEIKMVVKKNKFKLYWNGKKFAEFKARGNVEDIKAISVGGQAYIYQAKILERPENPIVERIPRNLTPGSWIVVHGTAKKDASGFVINLQCGDSTSYENDVALHFNPRLNDGDAVRNTFADGAWQEEENHQPYFPFEPKDAFEISINVQPDAYRVFVNGRHYFDYNHRIAFDQVCHVMLSGDANFFEPDFFLA